MIFSFYPRCICNYRWAVLFAIIIAVSIMTAPGVFAQENSAPANVVAIAGPQDGTAVISWSAVETTNYYRIGWISETDYLTAVNTETDWLDAFVFADVVNTGQTSYIVKGLESGNVYYFSVGTALERYGKAEWSDWTNLTLTAESCFYSLEEHIQSTQMADRAALIEFYHATNGDTWIDNTNWLSDAPLDQWTGVEVNNMGRVSALRLPGNNLNGTVSATLGRLTELRELWLHNNSLHGTIPPELGNLTNLLQLYLSDNSLSGSIPPELSNLNSLRRMSLDSNGLHGTIPPELGNLVNLLHLVLANNSLSGSIPPELSNLNNLQRMSLDSNGLHGTIPTELGNLTNLLHLVLSNNSLSGSIPPELSNLNNLQRMSLDSNALSGTIPPELGRMIELRTLDLSRNRLSGSVPTELGDLTNMNDLGLGRNALSGTIPPELGRMIELIHLSIGRNQLSGSIPTELGNLTNLRGLYLNWNQLSGEIPQSLNNIKEWDGWQIIAGNNFTGCIPAGMASAPGDPGDSSYGNIPFCDP